MKPKICIYTIALNEEKFVDRFMDYCSEADLVLVCDTGSSDNTVRKLKTRGAEVYSIKIFPWRFDHARATALSLVPTDIDICITLDLDECIQPGWRQEIERAWEENNGKIGRIRYEYTWNWKLDGTPDVVYFGDRTHARFGYVWKHPCHETLHRVDTSTDEVVVTLPKYKIHHHADDTKSRGQYLGLLSLAVKEDPNDDRMAHYYARELFFNGKYDDSIKEFNRHLALSTAWWNEERAASYGYMSKCYINLKEYQKAQDAAIKGTIECSSTREPWLQVARAAYHNSDWLTCYWAGKKCLSITNPSYSYISSKESWGWEPYDLTALGAHNYGLDSEAVKYGKLAISSSPGDERLKRNLKFYEEKLLLNSDKN